MASLLDILRSGLGPYRVWGATAAHQGAFGLARSAWFSGRLSRVRWDHLPLRVHSDSRVEIRGHPRIETPRGGSLVLGYVNRQAHLSPVEAGAALLRLNEASVIHLAGPGDFLCGPRCTLALGAGATVHLGSNSYIAGSGKIIATREIHIGDDVAISWGVTVLDSNLHEDGRIRRDPGPVRVGNRVWIGHGASIMPGVTIGDDAIVAARACVTKDVAPGETVAGVPATPLRR
jgi:acetyltransferase-like isoleucine patch superfamily enzyme